MATEIHSLTLGKTTFDWSRPVVMGVPMAPSADGETRKKTWRSSTFITASRSAGCASSHVRIDCIDTSCFAIAPRFTSSRPIAV